MDSEILPANKIRQQISALTHVLYIFFVILAIASAAAAYLWFIGKGDMTDMGYMALGFLAGSVMIFALAKASEYADGARQDASVE